MTACETGAGMIAVLAVKDPDHAQQTLHEHFGFRRVAQGLIAYGDAKIAIVPAGTYPGGMIALPFDHIAFRVPDADDCYRRFLASGAHVDKQFTPDGPRDITEFWTAGVRFVFFEGPDAAPFEFCAQNDPSEPQSAGHSHFAIRTPDLDATAAQLCGLGATEIARHLLPSAPRPVAVRFLRLGAEVFELFDEAPLVANHGTTGWVGLIPRQGHPL